MSNRQSDESMNLDQESSQELRRDMISQDEPGLRDSAVIPDIEGWLRGRSPTDRREILRHPFRAPESRD